MTTKEAINHLCEALRTDSAYYYTWQSNIAMQFQDEFFEHHKSKGVHEISNAAAKRFLDLLLHTRETNQSKSGGRGGE